MSMSACLQISGLAKRYGSMSALDNVNLCVARGSVLAVLGPNGAGKSTLFGCVLGLTRPTDGQILLQGHSVADADRRRIGYLAERVAFYPQSTVWENAAYFGKLRGQSALEVETQLRRLGLDRGRNCPVRQLSKGMLQRLGLAIAFCGQPELLVLDEPFNGLDPVLLDGLQSMLREEQARGATLLISTHTLSAVESLATHIAILLRGRLAACGTLASLRDAQGGAVSLETIYYRIARRTPEQEEVLA